MRNKLLTFLVTIVVVLAIGGIGYVLYSSQKHMDETVEAVNILKQEVETANEKAENATASLEETEKRLSEAEKEAKKYKKEVTKLQEEQAEKVEEPTVTETPIPTPEPTVVEEQIVGIDIPDPYSPAIVTPSLVKDELEFDTAGRFAEPMSGRVQINVSYCETDSEMYSYNITITGANSAWESSEWNLYGKWDMNSDGICYIGTRTDTTGANGVVETTTFENQKGLLRYDGPNTLYWTDLGTGNYDRGPFVRY